MAIKQLIIEIPEELHTRYKANCALRQKTMREDLMELMEASLSNPTLTDPGAGLAIEIEDED